MARNSDNTENFAEALAWAPVDQLWSGMLTTYRWIESQLQFVGNPASNPKPNSSIGFQ